MGGRADGTIWCVTRGERGVGWGHECLGTGMGVWGGRGKELGSGGGWNSTGVGDTCRVRAPRGGRQGHAWGVGRPRVGCGGAELWGLGSGMGWGAVPQIGAVGEGSLFGSGLYGEWGHAWGGGGVNIWGRGIPPGGNTRGALAPIAAFPLARQPHSGHGENAPLPPLCVLPSSVLPIAYFPRQPPPQPFPGLCPNRFLQRDTVRGGGVGQRHGDSWGGGRRHP